MSTLKLFSIVFFAVFLANVLSHFAIASIWVGSAVSALSDFADQLKSRPSNLSAIHEQLERQNAANDPVLIKQRKELQELQIQQITAQQQQLREILVPRESAQIRRARENDQKICKFWRDQYLKDQLENSKIHMESSCKRANSH